MGPTLVIVEDVHWVDEATLDLLRYTGRRISGLPVLALVSYRDDQVKPYDPIQIVIGDLATLASTHDLVVPPLSRSAVLRAEIDQTRRRGGGPEWGHEQREPPGLYGGLRSEPSGHGEPHQS